MLKQYLSFRRATMAVAAMALTTPVLGQIQQEQDQERRQQEQQRQRRQQQQQQQQGQQGQPGAVLPDEVRQVLTSLDGTWTVEGTFFAEENGEDDVSHRMTGTANRKWILNNNILQADVKLHDEGGQGVQPGQREPGQPGDMNRPSQPDRQTRPGQQPRPGQQRQPGQAASTGLEGMWFIGYDTAKDEYTAVWMDSKSPAIRCDTGRWESSERKLVFEGEYTKPEDNDTISTRLEVQIQTDNRHVVTMFEDPGLLDPERRAYMLTFIREGGDRQGQRPGQQPAAPGQQPGGLAGDLIGQVASIREAQMPGMDAADKTFAHIRLQDGKDAYLAFDQQVDINRLGISAGDQVTVKGSKTEQNGRTVINVESIEVNGQPVEITGN